MVLLVACTEEATSRMVDPVTLEALTMEEPEDLPGRAAILSQGVARSVDQGPALTEEGGYAFGSDYPVVAVGEGIRVVARRDDLRLLLWVDRDQLRPVVAETTWVDGDGHRAHDGAAAVRIEAGTSVGVDDDGTFAVLGGRVGGTVRVADGLVDEAWWPDTQAPPPLQQDGWLLSGTAFRDAEGRVLLELAPDERKAAAAPFEILDEDEGRLFVRARLETWSCGGGEIDVRGWVDPGDVAGDGAARLGFGFCCGCCGFGWGRGGSGASLDLPAGTLLFDAPDGEAVGIAEADVSLSMAEDEGEMPGWNSVRVPTAWGDAVLWVATLLPPVVDSSDLAWEMRSM